MDRGAWQAAVHRITKSQTQVKQLNTHTHMDYVTLLPSSYCSSKGPKPSGYSAEQHIDPLYCFHHVNCTNVQESSVKTFGKVRSKS